MLVSIRDITRCNKTENQEFYFKIITLYNKAPVVPEVAVAMVNVQITDDKANQLDRNKRSIIKR
jgi:hypothetical protein